jgi:hypothetical protein
MQRSTVRLYMGASFRMRKTLSRLFRISSGGDAASRAFALSNKGRLDVRLSAGLRVVGSSGALSSPFGLYEIAFRLYGLDDLSLERSGVRKMTREPSEMYRGYEIKLTEWGWYNIRRQSFGVASFHTIEEARRAIDTLLDKPQP